MAYFCLVKHRMQHWLLAILLLLSSAAQAQRFQIEHEDHSDSVVWFVRNTGPHWVKPTSMTINWFHTKPDLYIWDANPGPASYRNRITETNKNGNLTFKYKSTQGVGISDTIYPGQRIPVFYSVNYNVAKTDTIMPANGILFYHDSFERDGEEVVIDAALIKVGERFVVRPGEIIAADGIVEEGESSIDASMLTGESVPVDVKSGSKVTGTTVNLSGRLIVKARRVGADSTFAQMTKLVRDAQSTKAPVQKLADRVSSVFVPTVIVLALLTFLAWYFLGDDVDRVADSFTAAVAVLIIACPCALGLATPTALMVGSGRAAQMGIVIKGVDVLQSTRRIDTVVFDKTGTVTTGVMQLVDVVVGVGATRAEVLGLAGAVEHASEHPVAKAIASAAKAELGQLESVQQFESVAGMGTSGVVDGKRVLVGGEALMNSRTVIISATLRSALQEARNGGNTAVLVAYDGSAKAVCVVADRPKQNSAAAIAELRNLGLRPVLLTGDNRATAVAVAEQVGIETDDQHVIAGVLPAEKVRVVADLQERGYAVAMVGDGVNDAAALAQADVGIAMGTGTDVAMNASDLTIVSGDLRLVSDAILLSRATLRTISANVFWAFAYNIAAIPLAALGYMNPMWAGLAMAFSSVFVVSNSLRLRTAKLTPHTAFVHATR